MKKISQTENRRHYVLRADSVQSSRLANGPYFLLWGTINADGSIDKLRRYSKAADRSYYVGTFVKLRQTERDSTRRVKNC